MIQRVDEKDEKEEVVVWKKDIKESYHCHPKSREKQLLAMVNVCDGLDITM